MLFSNADLAHQVEHLICNQGVAGSSPAVGTKQKRLASFSLCAGAHKTSVWKFYGAKPKIMQALDRK